MRCGLIANPPEILLTNYVIHAGQPALPALPAHDGEGLEYLPIATSWAYFGPREML